MINKKYRVLIIEPSTIIYQGLKYVLEKSPNFSVIGYLRDIQFLPQRLPQLKADIIIVNPNLFGFHKRQNISNIFQDLGSFYLIGLSYAYSNEEVNNNFSAIIGILDEGPKIINTITNVVSLDKNIEKQEQSDLSDREKEILISIAKGMQNKEIADQHNISIHTVISHRKNISKKTGIKSVSGLTIYALLNNLINKDEFV
ncbi:MAG: response regulator transcription factor [Bacteroidales bacterium]|jgi:DNA-binding NarL/FixJ family response regulator|nr:response regulator transcription factor [Bacteroidales bacterium]